MNAPSVVITGIGALGPAGPGLDSLRNALRGPLPTLREIDPGSEYHGPGAARHALLLGDVKVNDWISPLAARRMGRPSRWAVAAARMALAHAGRDVPDRRDASVAVTLATAFGPSEFTQRLLDQILHDGPGAMSPALFTECVANAPASQVSIHCRTSGTSHTLCGREAGPIMAVAHGANEIERGRSRLALVGAVEEMTPLLHGVLGRFGALARPGPDAAETARPFDLERNGFIAAEGATVVVLEERSTAERRGGRVLAGVRGWERAFDPSASRVGWGTGYETMARGLRRCLERAGLRPDGIDVIVSGASGSRAGDRLEATTLRRVWNGSPLPPVVVPKSLTGEYGGAILAAAVLVLTGEWHGATAGFRTPDPELGIIPHDGSPIPPARRVLVTSTASGGPAAWLVLERA